MMPCLIALGKYLESVRWARSKKPGCDALALRAAWFVYFVGGDVLPLHRAHAVFSRPADAELPRLRVCPLPGVRAVFRFSAAEEIGFDVEADQVVLLADPRFV
jgi:hypothetical protein